MLLTTRFSANQYAHALSSWSWADLDGKVPVFTSLYGDVFFESVDGWWFLDLIEGTLRRRWDSRLAMEYELGSPEGRDRYLLAGMVAAARERGIMLGEHEVYAFVPPPIVRGGLDADGIQTLDFVVACNIAGQIHEQIRLVAAVAG
jgi:hypothetical protein